MSKSERLDQAVLQFLANKGFKISVIEDRVAATIHNVSVGVGPQGDGFAVYIFIDGDPVPVGLFASALHEDSVRELQQIEI